MDATDHTIWNSLFVFLAINSSLSGCKRSLSLFQLDLLCDEPTQFFVLWRAYHSCLRHLFSALVSKSCPLHGFALQLVVLKQRLCRYWEPSRKSLATTWPAPDHDTRRCKNNKCVDPSTVSPQATNESLERMDAISSDHEPSRLNRRCLVWNNPWRGSFRRLLLTHHSSFRWQQTHHAHAVSAVRSSCGCQKPTGDFVQTPRDASTRRAHGVDAQIGKVAAHLVVHGLGDHGRRNGCVSTSVEGPGAPRGPTLFVSANSAAGCHRWHRPRLHQGRGVLGRLTQVRRAVAGGHGNPQANMLHWSKGFREGGHHGAAAALHLLRVKHHALVACRGRVRNRGRDGRHLRDGGTSAELGPSQLHRSEKQHTETPLRSDCTTNRWPATRLRGTAGHRRLLQRQYSQREHPPTQQRMTPSSS